MAWRRTGPRKRGWGFGRTLRAGACVLASLLLSESAYAEPRPKGAQKGRPPEQVQTAWDEVMAWGPEAGEAGEGAAAPASTPATAAMISKPKRASKGKSREAGSGKSSRVRTRPIKKGVSPSYLALSAQWHAPAPTDQSYLSDTTPALVFQVVGMPTPVVVLVPEETGGPFEPEQLEAAREAFRAGPKAPPVNERLLGLIHRATRHFNVPYVHLISGVRQDRGGSRHTHGLAADIVLPGISDEELAEFFRQQGFVGVGVYTRSGFVHVDVRDRSFFWVDPSPPGKSMKIIPVLAAEAQAADAAAVARGEEPFVNPPRLSRALAKRSAVRRKKNAAKAASAPQATSAQQTTSAERPASARLTASPRSTSRK